MLMGIMGHFTDDEAYPIVSALQAGLPSGSYFALYDGASTNEAFKQAQQGYNASGAVPYHLRSPEQFNRFFEGLELVEPGVVPVRALAARPGHGAGRDLLVRRSRAQSRRSRHGVMAAEAGPGYERDITVRSPAPGSRMVPEF